jgi:hypothetical protein
VGLSWTSDGGPIWAARLTSDRVPAAPAAQFAEILARAEIVGRGGEPLLLARVNEDQFERGTAAGIQEPLRSMASVEDASA